MPSLTSPKIHHFNPLAFNRTAELRAPPWGSVSTLPEHRAIALPSGTTTYTFTGSFAPFRVDDILLEDTQTRRVAPNRMKFVRGTDLSSSYKTTRFERLGYTYDKATKTITFLEPTTQGYMMHVYDPTKCRSWNDGWFEVSINDLLIQGAGYIDDNLINPDHFIPGQFQGGFRCFPEIVSLPKLGLAKLSDDLLGFSYRAPQGYSGADSIEYLVYNSLGQVSDTYCYTFIC